MAFDQLLELVPGVNNPNDNTLLPLRGGDTYQGEPDDLDRRQTFTQASLYYDGDAYNSLHVWGEVQLAPVTTAAIGSTLATPFFASVWRMAYNPVIIEPRSAATGGTIKGWVGVVVGDLTYYIERLEVLQNYRYIDLIAHFGRATNE